MDGAAENKQRRGRGGCDRDAHRSECESHREVVQAERGVTDQQPPPVPDLRGVAAAAQCVDESVDTATASIPAPAQRAACPGSLARPRPIEHPGGRFFAVPAKDPVR